MKIYLVLSLLITTGSIASAQTDSGHLSQAVKTVVITPTPNKAVRDTNKRKTLIICSVSRGRLMSAVTVIFVGNKQIYRSDTGRNGGHLLGMVNPELIAKINVLNGTQAMAKYGGIARYGTIEISVDPKKNRPAYRELKKQIKESKRATGG